MKLYAISDLHVGYEINRQALLTLPSFTEDWLIVAGDVGETEAQFRWAWTVLSKRFARLFWTPGNHDLWTIPRDKQGLRGEAKYLHWVEICREYGVHTPEDEFVVFTADKGQQYMIAPTFTLYDYTFRPDEVPVEEAVAWAAATDVVCMDEYLLYPDPYPSRRAWCQARCTYTQERLAAVAPDMPIILVNHFPLRQELARLPRIPRFSVWCGTRLTQQWHTTYNIHTVVYGHLHIRGSYQQDGVRFEEVSLGYPRHWSQERGATAYLRPLGPR